VRFLLEDVLDGVVNNQPSDHPLRRVDRDTSTVYETGDAIGMSAAIKQRKEDLQHANYVAVASETTNPTPAGPGQRYELQTACSIRLEGLTAGEYGHIDTPTLEGVSFDALFRDVFEAVGSQMSYPDVGRSGVSYRDLKITNVDDKQSQWADFHRASFDVVFRGYTETYD
jgi:hypothetical protein